MVVLGVNIGFTQHGLEVFDGGACLLVDGQIHTAIAEERITRIKHKSGFDHSVHYVLENAGLGYDDVDYCGISFFGQEVTNDLGWLINNTCLQKMKNAQFIAVPSHHLSHALTAWHFSNFEEAIIMVMDNEGNAIGKMTDPGKYWKNKMERASFFIAKDNQLRLFERDLEEESDAGIGDTYRQVTHFVGFHSMYYAGKTMGLSAYGQPGIYAPVKLFSLRENRIQSHLGQDEHDNNWGSNVQSFFKEKGIDIGSPALPGQINEREANLARYVQDEIEDIILSKLNYLIQRTGIKKVCFGGGVALNVLVNSAILEKTNASDLFVHPNCDDQGQGIGNCLYVYHDHLKNERIHRKPSAYLGKLYPRERICQLLTDLKEKNPALSIEECEPDFSSVSAAIAHNKVIGWFQGRSEVGPRALGNRSIIANPLHPGMKDHLNNTIKFRESFRPFAPASTTDSYEKYFTVKGDCRFMLFSARVKPEFISMIPATTHVDHTARLQVVSKEDNLPFYALIKSFGRITGFDVLLNTSFNLAGQPIIESPEDAVNCFLSSNLDGLVLHNFFIRKRGTPEQSILS